jgi:hypothetical protein
MGGQEGGASKAQTMTMQDLVDQMKQDRMYGQIGQGFKDAGSIIGRQQPYVGGQQQGTGQVPGGYAAAPAPNAALASLSQLFPQGGASGINEQQLAAILSRLGYGG